MELGVAAAAMDEAIFQDCVNSPAWAWDHANVSNRRLPPLESCCSSPPLNQRLENEQSSSVAPFFSSVLHQIEAMLRCTEEQNILRLSEVCNIE